MCIRSSANEVMLSLFLIVFTLFLARSKAFESDDLFLHAIAVARENSLDSIREDPLNDCSMVNNDILSGRVVRVAYMDYYPHVHVLENGTAIGLYGEIIMKIKAYFNVSIKWIESVDGNWGAKVRRGKSGNLTTLHSSPYLLLVFIFILMPSTTFLARAAPRWFIQWLAWHAGA